MFVGHSHAVNIAGGRESLASAKAMEAEGKSQDWIFTRLGWFKGQDGHWRTEIPDNDFKLTGKLKKGGQPIPLSQAIKHDELFLAVPQMRNTTIEVDERMKSGEGGYKNGKIMVGNPSDAKTIIHEMQHDVQWRTGAPLQSKGSPGTKDHGKNVGEREAYNAEARIKDQNQRPELMKHKAEGDQRAAIMMAAQNPSPDAGYSQAASGRKGEPPIKIGVGPGIGIPFGDHLYGGLGFGKWLNGDKGWFWGPSVGTPVADNLGVGVGTVHPIGGKKAARPERFKASSDLSGMFADNKSGGGAKSSENGRGNLKKGDRPAG